MYPTRHFNNHRDLFTPFFFDTFAPFFNDCDHRQALRHTPKTNIRETDEAYTIEMTAPGMTKADLNVNLNDEGNLTIKMSKHTEEKANEEKNERYLRREFSAAEFEQTFLLPDNVRKESISAQMADGILTIILPKVVEEKVSLARQIEVQ